MDTTRTESLSKVSKMIVLAETKPSELLEDVLNAFVKMSKASNGYIRMDNTFLKMWDDRIGMSFSGTYLMYKFKMCFDYADQEWYLYQPLLNFFDKDLNLKRNEATWLANLVYALDEIALGRLQVFETLMDFKDDIKGKVKPGWKVLSDESYGISSGNVQDKKLWDIETMKMGIHGYIQWLKIRGL